MPPGGGGLAQALTRHRRWWQVAAVVLVAFALGLALGAVSGGPSPVRAGAAPAPAPTVPPASARVVVPASCRTAIKQGDLMIGLLQTPEQFRRQNERRLGEMLKSYTVAAQTCRKEASHR
jgi:hypothetical protein